MKKLLLLSVFIAFSFQCISQIDYDELPVNNISFANVHTGFDNGYITKVSQFISD